MPTQQYDLYAAERTLPVGEAFDSVDELQRFVDELRDTHWWQRDYAMVRRVEVGRADQRVNRGSVGSWDADKACGLIEMWVPGHMNQLYVCHELAHVLAGAKWGSTSHDPAFARTYGVLTYHVMGSEAWLQLQAAFDQEGIDYA